MAGSEHEAGSAPVPLKRKHHRIRRKKRPFFKKQGQKIDKELPDGNKISKKTICKIISNVFVPLIIVFLLYILCKIGIYAAEIGCAPAFWNAIYDSMLQLIGTDSIISLILSYLTSKGKGFKKALNTFFVIFFRCSVFFLALLCFFVSIKIQADKAEKKEHQLEDYTPPQNPAPKEVEIYRIDQDLTMHSKPLEDYYAGEITEKNRLTVMAEILYNNMEYNKPNGNNSPLYNYLRETADGRYKSYISQKAYSEEKGDTNEILFEDRINKLEESLDSLKEANKEYESPDNENRLANGYKDMGDEYFGRKNQQEAINAYEMSQEWCMKSIYHAAAIGDFTEMNSSMELFKKLGVEVSKLDEVSEDRVSEIITNIEVYGIFTDKVNESQK